MQVSAYPKGNGSMGEVVLKRSRSALYMWIEMTKSQSIEKYSPNSQGK